MASSKLEKLRNAQHPKTKENIRSFLGLAGHYRKYIPNFAEIAVPLNDLTKDGQPKNVQWGPYQQKSFETLKTLLTQAPILRLPDFKRPFIVQTDASDTETDASDTGVGASLVQDLDNGRFPVVNASKKLLSRERNYSVIEGECLTVEKFQNV